MRRATVLIALLGCTSGGVPPVAVATQEISLFGNGLQFTLPADWQAECDGDAVVYSGVDPFATVTAQLGPKGLDLEASAAATYADLEDVSFAAALPLFHDDEPAFAYSVSYVHNEEPRVAYGLVVALPDATAELRYAAEWSHAAAGFSGFALAEASLVLGEPDGGTTSLVEPASCGKVRRP